MHCFTRRNLPIVLIVGLTIRMLTCPAAFARLPMHSVAVQLGEQQQAAARVRILAVDGQEYAPEMAAVRKMKSGESYFYADGSFKVTLPEGTARVFVSGGIEHLPQTIQLDVAADAGITEKDGF